MKKLKLTESSQFKCIVRVNYCVLNLVEPGKVILNIIVMPGKVILNIIVMLGKVILNIIVMPGKVILNIIVMPGNHHVIFLI